MCTPDRVSSLSPSGPGLQARAVRPELEAFFVKGKEGPLQEGELENAAAWIKGIMESKGL